MAGTTLKHRPTAGAAGNTAPGKMPGADASSTELKQEPAIKEETVSMIDALKNEWHLFVFIFLGALVPSLSQLKNLHPQVAYIIRSVFQVWKDLVCFFENWRIGVHFFEGASLPG